MEPSPALLKALEKAMRETSYQLKGTMGKFDSPKLLKALNTLRKT